MLRDQELASAAGRRPVSNVKVASQEWDDFEADVLSGLRTLVEPVESGRDATDIFAAATESEESKHIFDQLSYGPFSDKTAVRDWLLSWKNLKDPVFVGLS